MRTKRILEHRVGSDHDLKIDIAMVLCIEPRFWNAISGNVDSTINALVRSERWAFVPLVEAGGVKVLASDDVRDVAERESLLFRVEQELGIHHPEQLGISVHRDCGGYGYRKAFNNDEKKENDRLYGDLEKARIILDGRFGHRVKKIRSFVFDFDGVEEVTF